MADVIEIEYRAKVDALRREFNAFVTEATKGGKEIDAAADSNTKSYNKTSSSLLALRKQLAEIAKGEQELAAARAKSSDPKKIAEYNRKIQEARFEQKNLTNEINRTEAAANKTAKAGTNLVSQFKSVAATLGIAFGVAQIVAYGKEAFNLSAKAEGIRTAFSKIGGEATLEKLRIATRGATSDIELMQAALRAKNFGISTDLLAKGLELAGKVARTTGQDVTYLTDSFVDGLGRKSIRILDNLQISQVDLQKEIKRTGDFNTAVGNIVDKKLRETGVVIESTADKVARLGAAWDNFKSKVGGVLIDVGDKFINFYKLISGAETINEQITKNSLKKQQTELEQFNGNIIEISKRSEVERTQNILKFNAIVISLSKKLRDDLDSGKLIAGSKDEALRTAEIQNYSRLTQTLRDLNKKRYAELSEDQLKAIKDAADAKAAALKKLEELDIKADADSLKQLSETEQQKIEVERAAAVQEVLLAQKAALDAGVAKVKAESITQNALSNIKKTFDDKQKDLVTKNEKEEQDKLLKIRKEGEDAREQLEDKQRDDRIKKDKKAADERKQIEREAADFAVGTLGGIAQINSNNAEKRINDIEDKADKETEIIQQQLNNDVITKEQFEKKKAEINKRAADEEREIKRQAFETNKEISLIQTIISTSQATIAALGSIPYTPANIALAAFTAAAGAVQIAVIKSQPTPRFEHGGKVGGKRHYAGGTLIEAEKEEFVVNRVDAIQNNKLLEAVNAGKAQKFIWDNYTAPILKAHQQKNSEAKQASFADNLARSLVVNSSGFRDSNILDSLKYSRKAERQNILFLIKELKGSGYNPRKW